MIRKVLSPRPDWQEKAEAAGFIFHHVDGDIYWDESVCYSFTLRQVEVDIEDATQELVHMCLDVVDAAVSSEETLTRLAIPPTMWDFVRESWKSGDATLYGRFDFAYDGKNPVKMYEFNADTPTSLYESAYFQWNWLEDARKTGIVRPDADQYNLIQEKLIETLASYKITTPMHFSCVADSPEDLATVHYLRDCAEQAGITTRHIYIEDVGVDSGGQLVDMENEPIRHLFKLYPWEHMIRDAFGQYLPKCDTQFFEPPWKMILSNKGILPLLWERFPNHPNLLPAWFHDPYSRAPYGDYVLKPIFSREGANIRAFRNHEQKLATPGEYGNEGHVGQLLCPPPFIDGYGPVIGSWVVNNEACGMGIREDDGPITGNLSRFVPHVIEG
ncbi:glutathionylspermidine synthase family protein [Desulfovibrio sp. OttesenSCG-928-O18]|nr:glutathionylspermidine synthase family protein [Desulfovibrio sp. OttesenSCG-928-O18]